MTALEEATDLLRSAATRIAVVGASNDPSKFGNIIVKDLLRHGYEIFPVNLHESTIAGRRVYRTLADLPTPVDIVDVVTPPDVTHVILENAAEAGCGLVVAAGRQLRRSPSSRPRRPRPSRPSTTRASWSLRGA
jgi:predicted CoA-binding protein